MNMFSLTAALEIPASPLMACTYTELSDVASFRVKATTFDVYRNSLSSLLAASSSALVLWILFTVNLLLIALGLYPFRRNAVAAHVQSSTNRTIAILLSPLARRPPA